MLQAVSDIELDPSESKIVFGHIRSSCRLGTPLRSLVGRIRVVTSVGLGILTRLKTLLAEEERVVAREPLHLQVSYNINHVLVVVVYPLSTKRNNSSVSYNIGIELNIYINTTYIH